MSKLSRKTVTVYLQLKLMKMMVECWQNQSKKFIHNANMQTIRKKVLAPYFIFSSLDALCILPAFCASCPLRLKVFIFFFSWFFFLLNFLNVFFSFFLSVSLLACFFSYFIPSFLTFVFSLHSHEPSAADLWFGLAADHNLSLDWIFFSFGLFIDNLVCL